MIKSLLFDLDGVFYEGSAAIPGCTEVIQWVRERGIPYLFITNTTSKNRLDLVAKLYELGITADIDQLLTPPVAAVGWLRSHKKTNIALYVPPAIKNEFAQITLEKHSGIESMDAVVIGDLGQGWTYRKLNNAFRLLMQKPQPTLVALGMTRYWRAEDGLRLDVAPFITALQHASGVKPVVLGKPSGDFFQMALSTLNVDAKNTVIVGDDLYTDIKGGQQAGMRGVLVRTGKFQEKDLESDIKPCAVIDSIADLPDWWQQNVK